MENYSRDSFRSHAALRQSLRGRIGVRAFLFGVLSISTVAPVSLLGFNQTQRWAKSEIAATDRQAQAAAQSSSELLTLAMLSYLHAAESFSEQVTASGDLKREALQPVMISSISIESRDTANDFVSRVMAQFEDFRGAQTVGDDVTLVAVLLKPKSERV